MSDGKKHSIVSPSSSLRWLACPPSALLAEKVGGDEGSVYADEGTLAHRFAELYLLDFLRERDWLRDKPKGTYYDPAKENPEGIAEVEGLKTNPLFYDDMISKVRVYTDYVIKLFDNSGTGAKMEVEKQIPLFYKSDENGTIDSLIYGGEDQTLYVTDLKFGRGILVEAKNNKQLLIYAINALDDIARTEKKDAPVIKKIVMTIVQPRRDSITSWTLEVDDLEIERDIIEAGARKALKGEGRLKTGSHCKFCPVKPRCQALKEEAEAFSEKQVEDPALLTDAEITELLCSVDMIADWAASVKKHALKRAIEGVRYEGYKLVDGTSRRQITDEKAIFKALIMAGYEKSLLKRSSFVTITELEKIVAKDDFMTCCNPYIIKSEASPLLVEDTDPRAKYGIAKAIQDFAEFNTSKNSKNDKDQI
jgi:hypothetical protein